MIIAVSASHPDLSSLVDPRFGRCPYFLFVDSETMEFEAVENPNVEASGGAGIQSAQLIANKGADVVLTGSCKPNAFQTLQAAEIKVIVGVTGTVKEAIQQFKSGRFQSISQPNVPTHFGMGRKSGFPQQQPGIGSTPVPPDFQAQSPEEELQMLKSQADILRKQLENITKRIQELDRKKK